MNRMDKSQILGHLRKAERLLKAVRQEHWAIQLAFEYIQQAYQEIRDVGI